LTEKKQAEFPVTHIDQAIRPQTHTSTVNRAVLDYAIKEEIRNKEIKL